MGAALDLLFGEGREPALDLVAGMPNQPTADKRRLVSARVVEDEMHAEVGRNLLFDMVEEAAELNRTVPAVKFPNHLAAGHIEGGEERGGAAPAIIVGAPLG